jgi:HlyD family secretion protein
MRPNWVRWTMTAFLGLLIVAAVAYAFMPRPVPADLAAVTRGTLIVAVEEEGRTRVKEAYVVSAPVAGRVLRIERHVGDGVTAGETVIASIRPTDPTFLDVRSKRQAEAMVQAAMAAEALAAAELQRADAERDFAAADLERARKLAAGSTISRQALDRAEMQARTRRAAVAAATALLRVRSFELETARAALIEPGRNGGTGSAGDCCIEVRSPVSGRVLRLLHESESVIVAGTPLVEIGDPSGLELVVDLLSADAVRVAEGAEVMIEQWGGDSVLAGRVRRIEPYGFTKVSALGIEEQRVNVIIDFSDPPARWRQLGHGYRVVARIVVSRGENVLLAPVNALFREDAEWAVFLVAEGRARTRRVTVGRRNSRHAEILDGLAEGEILVVHPSDRITDGALVAQRPGG